MSTELRPWPTLHLALFFALAVITPARAATNVITVDARAVLVSRFEGWGTSLCWWANVVGGFTNREEYADLAFRDLGLNIVRYNIGGGENPARSNTMEFRARMPGFQPEPGKWDWDADANQRWMLRAAVARGVTHVVAFANSPPYWMTRSGSVTGARRGGEDNLRREQEANFAEYLAVVMRKLSELDGVTFHTVTPMNEPGAAWWQLGHRQEGTHMSAAQQIRVIRELRAALDREGVTATIVATEDYDERSAVRNLSAYDPATWARISHITTHTYQANDSERLRQLAEQHGKPLWVSEYGDGERTGMELARRIRDDITGKRAAAWIYWQVADNAGAWGLVFNRLDGRDTTYRKTRKFYVLAQFSRFLRPGCRIVAANDGDSLAAYDPDRKRLIVVSVNDRAEPRQVRFEFAGVATPAKTAQVHRTSREEDCAPQPDAPVHNGQLSATLPARSVTTFVISDVEPR